MVSTSGFGLFSDFARIYYWVGETLQGNYAGLYPYPLMVLLAPIRLLPLDVVAALWLVATLVALVLVLRRESLYWMLFVPFLQGVFLGQLDPLFWLVYRSRRPWLWALLSLKPQLLPAVLPRILSSRRSLSEFLAGVVGLHLPFLLIRPAWPAEWIAFVTAYPQNRIAGPEVSSSGAIIFSLWILPFAAALLALFWLRRANWEGILFLANPALLPYDYSLLMGRVSKIIVPLSWVALWAAWRVQAGWPYAFLLLAVLAIVTIRERRSRPSPAAPQAADRDVS